MKRRDPERKPRFAGCHLKLEGAAHAIWLNPKTGITETVPRHNEIKENFARRILKSMGAG